MTEMQKGAEQIVNYQEKIDNKSEDTKYKEGLKATEKITYTAANSLHNKLQNDPESNSDDAKITKELLEMYKKRYLDSSNELKSLEGLKSEIKNEISNEKLKTITNREFLSLDKKDRLQYVTKNNVDFSNIANGNIDNVTFFFDQDGNGRDDSDLYRLTTLGQIMDKEVGEVESNGKIYTRTGLDGEFFNGNNRLTIHTNTEIQINKLRAPEDIQKLNSDINSKLSEFSKEQQDVAREALERGIKDKETIRILSEVLDNNKENISKKVAIEELFTEVERIRGMFGIEITNPKFNELIIDKDGDGKMDGYNNTDLPIVGEGYYDSKEKYSSGYEKYKDLVIEVTQNYPRISEKNLKNLINHENYSWNPNAKAPGSSAYGLGQMINSTWLTYGKGLDRSNPSDQLEATCRYLDAIMTRQNCNIEYAMAYYNTGEGIKNVSDSKAREFASINPAIAKYIDGPINADSYFNAAVKYYNT